MKRLLSMLLLALVGFAAPAREAVPMADDEAVEQRLIAVADELRCLVCQNESLAGSRAELAEDLRREIRGLIKSGKTDPEILDFLVTRYGDFVRYRPPFKPSTWLLWGSPFLFLAIGIGALAWHLRRRAREAAPLSAAERARAAELIAGER
jgi:cytochrome c-type biogenesis protein CcmH